MMNGDTMNGAVMKRGTDAWHRHIRHAGLVTADQTLGGIIALTALIVAARLGSLEQVGLFAALWALSGVQMSLVGWGTATLLFARAARNARAPVRLQATATALTAMTLLTVYAITFAVLALVSDTDSAAPSPDTLYALIGLRMTVVLADPLRMTLLARSQARHQANAPATAQTMVMLRTATCLIACAALASLSMLNAPIGAVATIVGLEAGVFASVMLGMSYFTRRTPWRTAMRRERLARLMRTGLPLLVHAIAIAVYMRFDLLYVAWRFDAQTAALYAGAARLAEAGNMAALIAALTIAPALIHIRKTGRKRLFVQNASASMLGCLGLSLAAASLAFVAGSWLLSTFFTPAYAAAAPLFTVYVLAAGFVAMGTIASRLLFAETRRAVPMAASCTGAMSNIILTVTLCEVMGPLGAAVATVISYALVATVQWRVLLSGGRDDQAGVGRTRSRRT